jgi:hypothetical protein
MSMRFCSWLMSFSEFMYGKMRCAYMTSCVAAEGEVLFVKMRHRQQRYGCRPVNMSFLHEAMCLIGVWNAKMRQRGPVVRSDMWRCCCVQVLVCEALQLKHVTIIKGSGVVSQRAKTCAKTRWRGDHLHVSVRRSSSTRSEPVTS